MSEDRDRKPGAVGPEQLEGGLRAAFSRQPAAPAASVLNTIEALSGAVPRVLLRTDGDQDTPVVKPQASAAEALAGRYQVVGELARGGVGVILKARDADLGRDVAMKVLRSDHMGNDELLQRFIEEAQIGGQLQHPGIVPVYELGLQADQRPYFTMKLVKGRTLSALLSDRPDPGHERGRHLALFHQVCQTLAYAHSRGVVHRDLKPANIMVGAFGEVQVVDWGFAKVLLSGGIADERKARETADLSVIATHRSGAEGSGSMAGSVMGTPAYMPPEQALGEVDNLDERSDVFSLGAILCEILTGEPPYTLRGGALLVQAAKGELEDALDRLDACGADPEIVDLAKGSLSTRRAQRPRDAAEIAGTVGAYLASIDARAKAAEMRAAASRTRSRWGAALAVVLLLAGAGVWWADKERHARITLASRVASESIEDAMLHLGRARGAPTEDLTRWPVAREAAAQALARAKSADDATRTRARALVETVDREEQAAEAAATIARTDREMMIRLTEIQTSPPDVLKTAERVVGYADAFASYGLDVDRIRASAIRDELIGALDDWGGAPAILARVDRDRWRSEIRAISRDDATALKARAQVDVLEGLPLSSLLLLGDRLGHAGRADLAIRVCRTARDRFPDSFWSCIGLARWCARSEDRNTVQASVAHLAAALALRPGALAVRYNLSNALFRQGDLERALAEMQKLHDRAPGFPGARPRLASLYNMKARAFYVRRAYASAARAHTRAIELGSSDSSTHYSLSRCLWETGARERAIEPMRASIKLDGQNWYAHYWLGTYLAATRKDQAEAITEFGRALQLQANDQRGTPNGIYRGLAQSLGRSGDHAGALEAHRTIVRTWPSAKNTWAVRSSYIVIPRLLEKQDGAASAIAFLEKAVAAHPGDDWLYPDLAFFLLRAGRGPEAEAALNTARALFEQQVARYPKNGMWVLRQAYLIAHGPLKRMREPLRALALVRAGLERKGVKEEQASQHDRVWFLGPVLYRNGKYKRALETLAGTGRFGEHFHAHLFVALSHKALGNGKKARAAWNRALAAKGQDTVDTYLLEEAREIMRASR